MVPSHWILGGMGVFKYLGLCKWDDAGVDLQPVHFQVVKANREKWLAVDSEGDHFRRPGPIRFTGKSEEERPITLELNALADQGD